MVVTDASRIQLPYTNSSQAEIVKNKVSSSESLDSKHPPHSTILRGQHNLRDKNNTK